MGHIKNIKICITCFYTKHKIFIRPKDRFEFEEMVQVEWYRLKIGPSGFSLVHSWIQSFNLLISMHPKFTSKYLKLNIKYIQSTNELCNMELFLTAQNHNSSCWEFNQCFLCDNQPSYLRSPQLSWVKPGFKSTKGGNSITFPPPQDLSNHFLHKPSTNPGLSPANHHQFFSVLCQI